MTDIVDRLRAAAKRIVLDVDHTLPMPDVSVAADEIERLRARIGKLREVMREAVADIRDGYRHTAVADLEAATKWAEEPKGK